MNSKLKTALNKFNSLSHEEQKIFLREIIGNCDTETNTVGSQIDDMYFAGEYGFSNYEEE